MSQFEKPIEKLMQEADDLARQLPGQIYPSPDNIEDRLFFKEFDVTKERLEILYEKSGEFVLKASQVKISFPTDGKSDSRGDLNLTIVEASQDSVSLLDGNRTQSVITYSAGNVSAEASPEDIRTSVTALGIGSLLIQDVIQDSLNN